MSEPVDESIETKLKKLGSRIKNTSTVRFAAAKRIRFNYALANLTVVVLSLWAIFFSYLLVADPLKEIAQNTPVVQAIGILLPVFIVVFSLIEGGQNLVRAHLMELNARHLRELGDKLFTAAFGHQNGSEHRIKIFEEYSHMYNDILERSPVNHDDVDHWGRHFAKCRREAKEYTWHWWYYLIIVIGVWLRRQGVRILYLSLWFLPFAGLVPPSWLG